MRILYAASEAAPFAKSGGLADVAGALPKALVRDGVDARVIMPLYGDLKFRDTLEYVTNYSVPVGWRSQYCGLFKTERNGVTYYFLDNEYYFKRRGLYGFYDDGERFAFFARAILEMLFYTDFEPDIINCNVEYVVTDKNVHITEDKKLAGTDTFPVFVAKNHSV